MNFQLRLRQRLRWFLYNNQYLENGLSFILGYLKKRSFSDIKVFVFFSGYPRSGHSLIGSLIDAHPDAVIAHELDAFSYLASKKIKYDSHLYARILAKSIQFGLSGNNWSGYSYNLSSKYQGGRFRNLHVIGDKKGGITSKRLFINYELVDQLLKLLGDKPIKVIHIVRNPFDNISTRMIREEKHAPSGFSDSVFNQWFKVVEQDFKVNRQLINDDRFEVITQRIEDFIREPKVKLVELLQFLNLELDEKYIEACSKKINSRISKTRLKLNWTNERIVKVDLLIQEFDFLNGYSYYD